MSDLFERYAAGRLGTITRVPLEEYTAICCALGRTLVGQALVGPHGGIMLFGDEFMPEADTASSDV